VFFVAAGTVERFTDAGGLFNGLFKARLDILGATPAGCRFGLYANECLKRPVDMILIIAIR
jgi:hypothetical protein